MKMYVCAVFDRKINAYMNPQFFRTKGEAMRAWMDGVHSEAAPFKRHAEDYIFCFLGMYDDTEGRFENAAPVPELLMSALDCIQVEGSVN